MMCLDCHRKLESASHPHVLYIYNEFFRELLYRYKGLGDLMLAPLFLEEHKKYLKKRYKDYTIAVVPSFHDDNLRRGFAFLPWIYRELGLPIISPFLKQLSYKQATSKHRERIKEVIVLKEHIYLKDKKILLVDDVMTSGYTLKTCKALLETLQPKVIDYLVLAAKKENLDKKI